MASYVESVDNAITVFLRRNNMTQEQLASRLGMSEVTLRSKRTGVTEFKLSELIALSEIFDTSLDSMVFG